MAANKISVFIVAILAGATVAYLAIRRHRLASPRTEYWGTLQDMNHPEDKIKVFIVDGAKVRKDIEVDFTMGGHGYVYDWVPKNEIWIDNGMNESERPATAFHENYERGRMKYDGLDYDEAHEEAAKLESEYRNFFKVQ